MGIKIRISKSQLPLKYQSYSLIETTDGVSDSVYLMGDKYVLKVFENSDYNIESEKLLLNSIRQLRVTQLVESFYIDASLTVVYKQIAGVSLYKPKDMHIKQIALFLKDFHNLSRSITSSNEMIFANSYLKDKIDIANNAELKKHYNNLNIELKNDGVIHGDLFCDNAKFVDDKLSGVFDFSEACRGDFLFDLAVVALSWCFDDNTPNHSKLNTLLENYEATISIEQFYEYIKYALVYYATMRFINKRDYKSLLKRLENL
ncbi:phosphotransferase [Arcobacteraceae bacterium]|nr:phosphotransferase [Arcobacteraceae bacterium]